MKRTLVKNSAAQVLRAAAVLLAAVFVLTGCENAAGGNASSSGEPGGSTDGNSGGGASSSEIALPALPAGDAAAMERLLGTWVEQKSIDESTGEEVFGDYTISFRDDGLWYEESGIPMGPWRADADFVYKDADLSDLYITEDTALHTLRYDGDVLYVEGELMGASNVPLERRAADDGTITWTGIQEGLEYGDSDNSFTLIMRNGNFLLTIEEILSIDNKQNIFFFRGVCDENSLTVTQYVWRTKFRYELTGDTSLSMYNIYGYLTIFSKQ